MFPARFPAPDTFSPPATVSPMALQTATPSRAGAAFDTSLANLTPPASFFDTLTNNPNKTAMLAAYERLATTNATHLAAAYNQPSFASFKMMRQDVAALQTARKAFINDTLSLINTTLDSNRTSVMTDADAAAAAVNPTFEQKFQLDKHKALLKLNTIARATLNLAMALPNGEQLHRIANPTFAEYEAYDAVLRSPNRQKHVLNDLESAMKVKIHTMDTGKVSTDLITRIHNINAELDLFNIMDLERYAPSAPASAGNVYSSRHEQSAFAENDASAHGQSNDTDFNGLADEFLNPEAFPEEARPTSSEDYAPVQPDSHLVPFFTPDDLRP